MTFKTVACSLLAITLINGCASEHEEHQEKETREAKLMPEARITKADAQATALSKVPNGTVKESELEREHGKLIWSFDVTTPGTKDITEVNIDAVTGDLVGMHQEKE